MLSLGKFVKTDIFHFYNFFLPWDPNFQENKRTYPYYNLNVSRIIYILKELTFDQTEAIVSGGVLSLIIMIITIYWICTLCQAPRFTYMILFHVIGWQWGLTTRSPHLPGWLPNQQSQGKLEHGDVIRKLLKKSFNCNSCWLSIYIFPSTEKYKIGI